MGEIADEIIDGIAFGTHDAETGEAYDPYGFNDDDFVISDTPSQSYAQDAKGRRPRDSECPYCGKLYRGPDAVIQHIHDKHQVQMAAADLVDAALTDELPHKQHFIDKALRLLLGRDYEEQFNATPWNRGTAP